MKPEHLGIEYNAERWRDVYEPKDIRFAPTNDSLGGNYENIWIGEALVGILEPRPHYCDRGRYVFKCELPDLDGADSFPRYYMTVVTAKWEIIMWLNWRLWRRMVS